MSKNQFTGTATQPQCNRIFCQFNKEQYCNLHFEFKNRSTSYMPLGNKGLKTEEGYLNVLLYKTIQTSSYTILASMRSCKMCIVYTLFK